MVRLALCCSRNLKQEPDLDISLQDKQQTMHAFMYQQLSPMQFHIVLMRHADDGGKLLLVMTRASTSIDGYNPPPKQVLYDNTFSDSACSHTCCWQSPQWRSQ